MLQGFDGGDIFGLELVDIFGGTHAGFDGANALSGLSFDLQDPRPVQDEARRAAVRDAMDKARLYAGAAGVTLGPILSITDAATPMAVSRDMPIALGEAARVPIAAGDITLHGAVTIVFAIE